MNILQLTKKYIAPIKDGESLAIASLGQGLQKEGCTISLLALNTKKHYSNVTAKHPDLKHFDSVETIDINTDIKMIDALLHFIYGKSYNVARYYSEEYEKALINHLRSNVYDAIILETLYMVSYVETIKKHSNATVVFRSHNLEFEIWKNLSQSFSGLKGFYFKHCSEKLLAYEQKKKNLYDLLVPISTEDTKKYAKLQLGSNAVCTVPVGLDIDKYKERFQVSNQVQKIGYIGSLDWKPNLEGLDWFFNKIWPELKAAFPQLQFHLAGRNLSEKTTWTSLPDVHYAGEVDSALDFLEALDIVIVPLLSGSGIRVKILESMAMGKLVMATEKALEGIPFTHQKNSFRFSNASDLIENFKYLESSSNKLEIQKEAMKLVKENFGQRELAKKLMNYIEDSFQS